jgi:hypothetical protein
LEKQIQTLTPEPIKTTKEKEKKNVMCPQAKNDLKSCL